MSSPTLAAPAPDSPPTLPVDYFDGLQARARPVRLCVSGGQLHIAGDGVALQVPVRRVSWPERQRHGERQAYLPGHGLLRCADSAAWDAWARASGLHEGLTVRWMQSWQRALLAAVLLVAVLIGLWRWGLPLAAHGLLALCPPSVDEKIGELVLEQVEQRWLLPTRLPEARQQAIRERLRATVARQVQQSPGHPLGTLEWTLHFRATPEKGIGPNAFAIPGGHLIVTDAMVELLADRPEVLTGVLGHELGHLQHRHGMRLVVQAALLAAVSSLVLGDFSNVLAAAPVLLGQAHYSRGFEFEADETAARLMRANGVDPAAFGVLFERIQAWQAAQEKKASDQGKPGEKTAKKDNKGEKVEERGFELPIGLSSHPPDTERVKRMRELPASP